jgi:hypothetical protein
MNRRQMALFSVQLLPCFICNHYEFRMSEGKLRERPDQ